MKPKVNCTGESTKSLNQGKKIFTYTWKDALDVHEDDVSIFDDGFMFKKLSEIFPDKTIHLDMSLVVVMNVVF